MYIEAGRYYWFWHKRFHSIERLYVNKIVDQTVFFTYNSRQYRCNIERAVSNLFAKHEDVYATDIYSRSPDAFTRFHDDREYDADDRFCGMRREEFEDYQSSFEG